jgi:hypothetical protein
MFDSTQILLLNFHELDIAVTVRRLILSQLHVPTYSSNLDPLFYYLKQVYSLTKLVSVQS